MLSLECVLFKIFGKNLKYEVVVGMNGRIWIKCYIVMEIIVVVNVISVL